MKSFLFSELTTFIKNVKSTFNRVVSVAMDNILYIVISFGVGAKFAEIYNAGFVMPLSFYTDTGLDVLAIYGYLQYQNATNMFPRRRFSSCAFFNGCISYNCHRALWQPRRRTTVRCYQPGSHGG